MVFSLDLRFLICFGGIFFSYLIYGILQENVYVNSVEYWCIFIKILGVLESVKYYR
jgi:uncharacterized protein with PQ loop repeat